MGTLLHCTQVPVSSATVVEPLGVMLARTPFTYSQTDLTETSGEAMAGLF